MSTQKSFIERRVQFEEDPMVAVEIGESSSPPPPLVVSDGIDEIYDLDMSDNLIADPNNPTRPNWAAKTIHTVGELAENPRYPRRTRSQFESVLSVNDPCFADKCFLIAEYDLETY